MDKQTLSAVPSENKIEELLTGIQPVPSEHFYQKMKRATWRIEDGQKVVMKKFRSKITFAVITLATLTLILLTPQGRAWAQEVAQFFKRINSTTIQLSDGQSRSMNELMEEVNKQHALPLIPVHIPPVAPEMATIPGCETPQKSQSYRCQIALAESKLGFDLQELPEKPKDWEFQSLSFDKDSRYAVITYELDIRNISGTSYSSLMLIQGVGDFSNFAWYKNNPWEAVPADKVEPVSIGEYKGEYVIGRFGLKPGDTLLTWFEDTREQRLIWSEGARWYLIDFSPNLNVAGTMGKEQLIHLAESLVASPIATTEPLNPAHLTSISDAEKISGLDLKSPTLLPMNIEFSYAHYFHDEKRVHLIYGDNEELDIQEWEGKPVDFKKPLGKSEFTCEITSMNGNEAFYCFFDRPNPRSFLWWRKDGLNYQMSYDSPFLGGKIDREEMLLIAESMQDIDDFQKNGKKSYEQVAIYAQALGLDIKRFPEAPAGWVFTNFWGEPYTRCIGLFYTSTTRRGTLFINECKNDQGSNTTAFPLNSIEQVMVGNAKGQYIAGGFALADNGKQIWDPTSPQKQLYWQADGLWMQMTMYGESAVLHNKEDLISIAESLR
jgi:hypothetical protein